MRLAEILDREFTLEITKQFTKDYVEFSRAFPAVEPTFREFLLAKRENWSAPFNQKDTLRSRHIFKGWSHCHLVYGKAILTYVATQDRIRCARITDHQPFNGPGVRADMLDAYLMRLDKEDFNTLPYPTEDTAEDDGTIELARSLFYEMAANREDRMILKAFANGSSDDAVEFFAVTEPPIEPSKAGGMDALRKLASDVLRTVPMNEGRNRSVLYRYHSTSADLESIRRHGLRSAEWEDEELDHLIGQGIHHLLFFTDTPQDEYGDLMLRFPASAARAKDAYSPDRGSFYHSRRAFSITPQALEMLDGDQWVPIARSRA